MTLSSFFSVLDIRSKRHLIRLPYTNAPSRPTALTIGREHVIGNRMSIYRRDNLRGGVTYRVSGTDVQDLKKTR